MNTKQFREKKGREKIVMVTAYDSITAAYAATAGIDALLVGDSLANTALGMANTLPVALDEMLHHARAVVRGAPDSFVVLDMPFLSYGGDPGQAFLNCGRALKEGGCQAVKLEGGSELSELVSTLVVRGIPVMGHLGLLPQKVHQYGGMFVQGRGDGAAAAIRESALRLVEAGIFALIVECIPVDLARSLSNELPVPVIGIGAGAECDGQIQVIADLLGMGEGDVPRHARKFADMYSVAQNALREYGEQVRSGSFPALENSFT